MRFLHTADWHVGKTLRGRSRTDEYAAVLDEVLAVARDQQVDAVLVAGDVFDTVAPPPEAERLVYDFLARLLPDGIACVLVAGNHDHPRRLQALSRLLEGLKIHIRAEVRPPAQGGVVTLTSRDGREEAKVAVLPFVPERKVVDACQLLAAENTWYEAYARRIEQMLAFLAADLTPKTVNLAVGHLLISGARVGTGERALHLGDAYGCNAQQLPAGLQYIALGHLHRPQEVLAPSRACYSGSLLELDFGELSQEKRLVVVEAHPGRPASIESIPLTSGRRLRQIEGSLDDVRRAAAGVGTDWLRVVLNVDVPVPGLADEVKERLPNAVEVRVVARAAATARPAEPRGHLGPADLFASFYAAKNGAPPDAALLRLFAEAYDQASHPTDVEAVPRAARA